MAISNILFHRSLKLRKLWKYKRLDKPPFCAASSGFPFKLLPAYPEWFFFINSIFGL